MNFDRHIVAPAPATRVDLERQLVFKIVAIICVVCLLAVVTAS